MTPIELARDRAKKDYKKGFEQNDYIRGTPEWLAYNEEMKRLKDG